MRKLFLAATTLLSACVSIDIDDTPAADSALLLAISAAHVRECPPERRQANARSEGFGATVGVVAEDIALTPLASDATRALRLRRIRVAPGGIVAWHDHAALQGMALIVSGEMVELRNSCLDPLLYRAGDVAIENAETAHSWRNESNAEAVVLASHVVAR